MHSLLTFLRSRKILFQFNYSISYLERVKESFIKMNKDEVS